MTEARQLIEENGKRTVFDESYSKLCENRWGKLLEAKDERDPIRNPYVRKCTALLLENEMDHIKSLHEDTLSSNAGAFTKYVFPVLRRVVPNLIANQLVSVQPGLVHGLMTA
jgi:hypothetical protein